MSTAGNDVPPMNSKGAHQRKLRNFMINPKYQLKYTFWLTFSGLFLIALNATLFYYYISENYAILVELSPMSDEAKLQLFRELREIIIRLAGISVIFLACVSLVGVIFSHRTAGPLYHFKRIFREIKEGNLQARVHLRPSDDFQDVAKSFNEMMDSVTERTKK